MALRARPGPTRRGGPSSLAQQQQRPVRPSSAVAASQRLRRLAARAVAASDGSGGNGNGRAPSSGGAATAAPPLPVHAPILDASFWRDSPPLAPPRPPPRATQQWPLPAHEPPPPDVPRTEAAELSLVAEQFWRQGGGFPRYLQATTVECEPCFTFESTSDSEDPLWTVIRREAQVDADAEPVLSSFLYGTVLAQASFDKALAFVLANRLASSQLLPTQLMELFGEVLASHPCVRLSARCDVAATRARDPACRTHADCLLYFKGYHALQAHRIAHALWLRGQTLLALALQSRVSEVFAVDIHPAATIGRGILLDHGTGVVIGETATVGDGCSILQGVTLGGTGKEAGDRHPKIGPGVLIGAHACVLGNIRVGEGAMIAAGALVLKPVAAHTMVAGSPAREVGAVFDAFPAQSMASSADALAMASETVEQIAARM